MNIAVLCGLAQAGASPTALEQVLVRQLDRAMESLDQASEPPHYVALSVTERADLELSTLDGALSTPARSHARYLDVDLRTGTPALDSTHPLRGFSSLEGDDRAPVVIPEGEGYALEHALWREIDARYHEAAERIAILRANRNVLVQEETPAPDFEVRAAIVDRQPPPTLQLDADAWSTHLLQLASILERDPRAHHSRVSLSTDLTTTTFVDTAGTRLVHGRRHARLSLVVGSTASDGDEVQVFRSLDVHDPERLPEPAALSRWADDALGELSDRLDAPRADPYSGPVLLKGKAAAVFFHEVLGHRVEGHRQKREDEGRTFAEQVGKAVLPPWIDVYDDPTISERVETRLNGHYAYDDEGVPAARAPLVEDGVFVGFLMGRSPIPGFAHSNGHGRRSTGNPPQSRMGNTLVETSAPTSAATLRRRLVQQLRREGLAFGYVVDEIEGGFTMTGRITPNAFNVRAATTWRVFADGRPDELVRGLDLVGTPLVAFGNLIAAGDDPQVFNGSCGAESGWVPVSAVAPSLLFSKLEFQLKEKGQDRPPPLSKPHPTDDGASLVPDPELP